MYMQAAVQKKGVVFGSQEGVVEETDQSVGLEDIASIHLSIRGSLTNLALQAKGKRVR